MENTINLYRHVTDGGAIYLTDNHSFADAKIIIRLDGGAKLVRCEDLQIMQQYGSDAHAEFTKAITTETNKELEGFTKGEWKIENRELGIYTIHNDKIDIAQVLGLDIPDEEAEANAEYIVKCVNSHAELVAALEFLLKNFDSEKHSAEAIIKANAILTKVKS